MKITQEGDRVRLQLVEYTEGQWHTQFNFTVDKINYDELKEHMIKALEEFEPTE